jgi:hypothetical protein
MNKNITILSTKQLEKMTPEQLEDLEQELWEYRRRVRVVIIYLQEVDK